MKYRHIVVIGWIASAIYIEWLSFLITAALWPNLPPKKSDGNSIRVLLVADAQIIGDNNEPLAPIGTIIRWDADRYLSASFKLAVSSVLPDVVVFLGDQMDEGSVATTQQFYYYVARLLTIYALPQHIKTIFVMGDNDVGGEGRDFITDDKLQRFHDAFASNDEVNVGFVQFYKINQLTSHSSDTEKLPVVQKDKIRVLLSHVPVIPFYTSYVQKVLSHFLPHFVFSAHEHNSMHFIGKHNESVRAVMNRLEDGDLRAFPLRSDDLHEIVVPTCSYRMGKKRMGFGAAQFDSSGSLHYTVLWLPSRYPKLLIYIVLLVFSSFLFIVPCLRCCKLCYYNVYRVFYKITQRKMTYSMY